MFRQFIRGKKEQYVNLPYRSCTVSMQQPIKEINNEGITNISLSIRILVHFADDKMSVENTMDILKRHEGHQNS